MQDLTLVGADDDGEHLVLATADGTRFRLRADDALRLAARRGPAAPQGSGGPPAPLTPREVQARLRAGEDASEIAAATGTAEDRVRRYEGPVLAERAHVASRARALPVRWRDGSGRSPALDDLVAERLVGRGVEAAPSWDAWRREDGAWLVQAVFRAGARERRATWSLDLQRSHLEALDDEARWLSSVDVAEAAPPQTPDPDGARTGLEGPRLAAVREAVYDVDGSGAASRSGADPADGPPVDLARRRGSRAATARPGRDAVGPEAGAGAAPAETGEEVAAREEADRRERAGRTLDLLEHLRGRRGRRQPLADPDDEELEALTWAELEALTSGAAAGDAGEPLGEDPWDAAGEPPAAHPPASRPQEALDDGVLALAPLEDAPGARLPGDGDAVRDPAAQDPATQDPAAQDPAVQDPADDADGRRGGAARDGAPSRRRRRRGGPPAGEDEGVPGQEELLPGSPAPVPPDAAAPEGDADAEGSPADEPARPRPARRGARPSVPSWDDIVFGQRRD